MNSIKFIFKLFAWPFVAIGYIMFTIGLMIFEFSSRLVESFDDMIDDFKRAKK